MKLAIIISCFLVVFSAAHGEITVIEQSDTSVLVRWELGGASVRVIDSKIGEFCEIAVDSANYIWDVGKPHMPVVRFFVRVGENAEFTARRSKDFSVTKLEKPILPSQPLTPQRWDSVTVLDTLTYKLDLYPKGVTKIVGSGIIHGDRFLLFELHPFEYCPRVGELRVYDWIELEVKWHGKSTGLLSPVFDPIKEHIFINPALLPAAHPRAKIVMIAPERYIPILEPLISWRKELGFDVTVLSADRLPFYAARIRDTIEAIYHSSGGIDYLVIVGDVDDVPTFSSGGSHSPTDIDYGCVDGSDFIPDILVGRISVEDSAQLAELVERFIAYEKFRYLDSTFAGRFLFGITDDSRTHGLVVRTHHFVRDNYLSIWGIGYEELDGDSVGESDVIAALDSGYAFYYYYGHGSPEGLSAPRFTMAGVDRLANANMYPFIVGNACSTNDFTRPESFGEALLRRHNKGAIAYIGGSNVTFWYPDSLWERETFRAFLVDSMSSVMGMCYEALLSVMAGFPTFAHYFFDVYNLIGDPSLRLWAGIPIQLDIVAPDSFKISELCTLNVWVGYASMPLAGVVVCALTKDTAVVEKTNSAGFARLIVPAIPPDTITLTASAFRKIPIQKKILPYSPDEPFIYKTMLSIVDPSSLSVRNDEDFQADFGETLAVELGLINYGMLSHDIKVKLTSSDSLVTVLHDSAFIDSLANYESETVEFVLAISPYVENNDTVMLRVDIVDGDLNSFSLDVPLVLRAPYMNVYQTLIDDSVHGDMDYVAEPGETIDVTIIFGKNVGCNIARGQLRIYPVDRSISVIGYDSTIELDTCGFDTILAQIYIYNPQDTFTRLAVQVNYYEFSWRETLLVFAGSNPVYFACDNLTDWNLIGAGLVNIDDKVFNSPPASFHFADTFYGSNWDFALVSPEFIIPYHSALNFWQKLFLPRYDRDDRAWVELWLEHDTIIIWQHDSIKTHWELERVALDRSLWGRRCKLAFRFLSNREAERLGWYVDDITVGFGGEFFGDASVSPLYGDTTQPQFTVGFTYFNPAGVPTLPHAVVDGTSYLMVPDGTYDTRWTRYIARVPLSFGVHQYHFEMGSSRFPQSGEFVGPIVGQLVKHLDFDPPESLELAEFAVEGDTGWFISRTTMAHSGDYCWNNFGSGTSYANYLDTKLVWRLDLSGLTSPAVTFWAYYDIAMGRTTGLIRDGGNVKVRTRMATWILNPMPYYDGYIVSTVNRLNGEPAYAEVWGKKWRKFFVDLSPFAGDSVELMFCFGTNNTSTSLGWLVDDLKLLDMPSTRIVDDGQIKPKGRLILSAYPNPFNTACAIEVSAPSDGELGIYDIVGKCLVRLKIKRGNHRFVLSGDRLPSGVYFVRVEAASEKNSIKIFLMK